MCAKLDVSSGRGQKVLERLAPEHLALEDAAKVPGGGVEGCLHGGLAVRIGFELQAGDLAVGDAAGDDPVEVAEIRRDVECEAVRGDALRDVDADGSDLFLKDAAPGEGPDTGALADALGHDAEVAAGADKNLFEQTNVVDRTEVRAFLAGEVAAEVDDGIADELARAVVGDVSTAIDFVEFDSALGEKIVAGENVGAMAVAAKSEDRRVFEQEQ